MSTNDFKGPTTIIGRYDSKETHFIFFENFLQIGSVSMLYFSDIKRALESTSEPHNLNGIFYYAYEIDITDDDGDESYIFYFTKTNLTNFSTKISSKIPKIESNSPTPQMDTHVSENSTKKKSNKDYLQMVKLKRKKKRFMLRRSMSSNILIQNRRAKKKLILRDLKEDKDTPELRIEKRANRALSSEISKLEKLLHKKVPLSETKNVLEKKINIQKEKEAIQMKEEDKMITQDEIEMNKMYTTDTIDISIAPEELDNLRKKNTFLLYETLKKNSIKNTQSPNDSKNTPIPIPGPHAFSIDVNKKSNEKEGKKKLSQKKLSKFKFTYEKDENGQNVLTTKVLIDTHLKKVMILNDDLTDKVKKIEKRNKLSKSAHDLRRSRVNKKRYVPSVLQDHTRGLKKRIGEDFKRNTLFYEINSNNNNKNKNNMKNRSFKKGRKISRRKHVNREITMRIGLDSLVKKHKNRMQRKRKEKKEEKKEMDTYELKWKSLVKIDEMRNEILNTRASDLKRNLLSARQNLNMSF